MNQWPFCTNTPLLRLWMEPKNQRNPVDTKIQELVGARSDNTDENRYRIFVTLGWSECAHSREGSSTCRGLQLDFCRYGRRNRGGHRERCQSIVGKFRS